MTDDKKEYTTRFIYRCSNCGKRVEIKSEDKGDDGFHRTTSPLWNLEDARRNYLRIILIGGCSHPYQCKLHDCGGANTIQWGRLELVGVSILEKRE